MASSFHVINEEVKDAVEQAMDEARAELRERLTVIIAGLHVAKDRIEGVAFYTTVGEDTLLRLDQAISSLDVAIGDTRALRNLYGQPK